MDGLSIFALILLVMMVIVFCYALIIVHDIPYHIALKRNHPHADAIHTAGWVSLFTLHVIWPFLWIWATLYQPERGYGFDPAEKGSKPSSAPPEDLSVRVERLEKALAALQPPAAPGSASGRETSA